MSVVPGMPRSLYAKLSVVLVLLLAVVGIIFLLVARYATDNYYQEVTQRLNGPIAMYVTQEHPLIENGIVNHAALESLAHQAMIINPTVEVYLLDPHGKILAHAFPPEEIELKKVDLEPIQRFLSGEAEMPLRNDDPRNTGLSKIFSVSPVGDRQNPEGYVYAILGGQKYQAVARSLEQSYVLKLTLALIGTAISFALLTGLVIFYALTRRLRSLDRRVSAFRGKNLGAEPEQLPYTAEADEIESLEKSFDLMAEQIVRQIERLQQTDAARRDLISNVSHDLRTPLASMQGYIETLLIRDQRLSADEKRQYLEIARKHAVRLSKLVSELFELSKLENLSLIPSPEPFSITELLQDIVQEFQLLARSKNVELALNDDSANVIVHGDIGLIQRVLENLIENALKHTGPGGTINIHLASKPQHVNVTVSDSGCGIKQENVSRIFDRFYRIDGNEQSANGSAGLGLAIVKRILDLHDSTIRVTSEVDVGTSFSFDLPTRQRAAA